MTRPFYSYWWLAFVINYPSEPCLETSFLGSLCYGADWLLVALNSRRCSDPTGGLATGFKFLVWASYSFLFHVLCDYSDGAVLPGSGSHGPAQSGALPAAIDQVWRRMARNGYDGERVGSRWWYLFQCVITF